MDVAAKIRHKQIQMNRISREYSNYLIDFQYASLRSVSLWRPFPLAAKTPLRFYSLRSFARGLLGKDEAEANDVEPETGVVDAPARHTTVPRAADPATAAQHAGRAG